MKTLPENSVDTCITDPPYELGFMGKRWDSSGVAFQLETWQAVFRVLKPGGFLLAFGGTRTYHRMVCAIEDAGFEIRDTIAWVYGCLSEDTEILTINGWERYHKNITDNPVLCYNIENDTFEFAKPTREFCYENEHTAYHIQSDYTDQVVSRNHRCIVERGGRKVFAYAETLQRQEDVPFLESLCDLPEVIYDRESHAGIKKSVLLTLCETPTKEEETIGRKKIDFGEMRRLWERVSQTNLLSQEKRKALLFLQMQRGCKRQGLETTRSQGQSKLESRIKTKADRKNDGEKQSFLERWSDLFQKAWQLQADQICSLSSRIQGHGEKRRLCYGTQTDNGAIDWAMPIETRGGSSYQSRPNRQSPRKSNVIQEQSRTQTLRSTRATITPIEYRGKVWCVEVPTGAFVARRNGKIFITGNSGFPKSHDISKGIDKQAGAEREVVGKSRDKGYTPNGVTSGASIGGVQGGHNYQSVFNFTAPATPEAQLWDGWGTALKPAHESIVVAMKPLDGTFANNALTWGVAGLWIDGGRVDGKPRTTHKDGNFTGNSSKDAIFPMPNIRTTEPSGRFPANFVHDGSDEVVGLFPQTKSGNLNHGHKRGDGTGNSFMGGGGVVQGNYGGDSGSAARFFYCAKSSRRERNNGLDCYVTVKYNIDKSILGGLSWKDVSTVAVQLLRRVISDTETVSFNIGEFGESITVQCHKDSLSIISMEISKIIESKILNSLMHLLTRESTVDVNYEMENGGNLAESAENLRKWLLTITKENLELARGVSSVVLTMLLKIRNEDEWKPASNFHATVKPLALMRYLARLTKTPTGGVVLDPFMGSGTTGIACLLEGREFIGIEREEEYYAIAEKRIAEAQKQPRLI